MLLPVIHQGIEVYLLYEIINSGRTFTALFLTYSMSSSRNSATKFLLHEQVDPFHVQNIHLDLSNKLILRSPLLCFIEPEDCLFYSVLNEVQLECEVTVSPFELHRVRIISDPTLVTQITAKLINLEKIYLADGHHRWHALRQPMAIEEVYCPILLVSHGDLNIGTGLSGIAYSIDEVKFHAQTYSHLAINSTIFTPKPLVDLIMYNIKTRVITTQEIFTEKFSQTQASL